MTTNELIDALRSADQSGKLQVVVGNVPIYTVDRLPAYYDGRMQELIQDHSRDPYYNIVGFRVKRSGQKINLCTIDFETVLWDNPDAEVDLSDLSERERFEWEARVAEVIVQAKSES